MARVDISIVMPAFNEGDALNETLPELYNYLKSLSSSFEIIIGDDGSTDNTKQIVTAFAKKHKNVRYVGYPVNQGKGHALSMAFETAKGNIHGFIDADLSIDKTLIGEEIGLLNHADIVIASKHAHGAKIAYPFARTCASYGFSLMTRMLLGLPVSDPQCGCKMFKANVLKSILPLVKTKGFLWDTEVLVRAHRNHYKIQEIPARVKADTRKSKVHMFRDTWRMLRGLLTLKRQLYAEMAQKSRY